MRAVTKGAYNAYYNSLGRFLAKGRHQKKKMKGGGQAGPASRWRWDWSITKWERKEGPKKKKA